MLLGTRSELQKIIVNFTKDFVTNYLVVFSVVNSI